MSLAAAVTFVLDPTLTGPELVQRWRDSAHSCGGYPQRIAAWPESFGEGEITVVCDPDPGHANFVGLVHGGLTASLIDIAGGGAVMTLLKPGERLLTTDIALRFLNAAPVDSGRLTARGRIVHRDARKAVVEVRVSDAADRTLALGTVGVSIRPPG
jgi:uncharacterized protein (TIGR00369 family)